jgi:aminomethyltransferase
MFESNPPSRAAESQVRKLKKTPLYSLHRKLNAKMVEFGGWQMPVQYRSIIEEHLAVRRRAGLFDVSHMGEIEVRGADALASCQKITANDLSRIRHDQAQYNLLLNERGGIVDDVIFHRLGDQHYLVCVNAANADKDFAWMQGHASGDVEVVNRSAEYAQLALQGPLSESILQRLTRAALPSLRPFHFIFTEVAGTRSLVARTGYTGEDGFELYCAPERAENLWSNLMETGEPRGLVPAGLGARDTLRLERALPLYGHELDETISPLEAGLSWVVKFSKGAFLGRERLLRQKEEGLKKKLIGLELTEPGIARSHCPVFKGERCLGEVTSGTKSPTLKKSIALGYVESDESAVDNTVEIEIRGRRAGARVVNLPFYHR